MNNSSDRDTAFLNRFRSLWARKRRVELGQVAVSSLLLALIGLGGLAIADYVLELNRPVRVIGLGALFGAVALFAINSLWRTVRCWSQPTTAAEIEAAFPQLGQSVRTTVQFGAMRVEQVQSEGVATKLVTALAEQTHQRALPLTIEDVVPAKKLVMIACGLAAGVALLAGASSVDWQWRNATQRAVLNEQPYRQLDVQPGDQTVDEGAGLQIHVSLIGRTNREVTLLTRPTGEADAEWTERKLEEQESGVRSQGTGHPSDRGQSSRATETLTSAAPKSEALTADASRPHVAFVAKLDRLTKPVEYRVTAGELASPVYQVGIRRPLRIDEVKVELTPPSYTGQPTSTSLDLNLSVLQGTLAKFAIQFDKPVKSASLVFAPRKQPRDDEDRNEAEVVPLELGRGQQSEVRGQSGGAATSRTSATLTSAFIELTLNEDRNYSIVAEAEDGTRLPESKYRIRVREDQPPQVTIEEPNDAVEVHTLAELLMRIRVRDDYGLAKAGVIFQINNEQEVPLISQDFETVVAAAQEAAQTGTVSPTTQAALEKVLPLEFFELTQKDSVMYFAFAEDNRPDQPQRTETDMQFIDIRPFKRTYQVFDPDPMNGMGMGTELKSLGELIQRQRFALNRTMQIEKRAASGRKPDATTLDQLMQFEKELAENVRDTAQGLEARGFDDTELFYQAETAMLAAVDSLSVGKWENATLQMKDALKALVEQRDRTRFAIMKNPDPARLAALRQFDRAQAQKLRRPKSDKEEARELIRRLEELMNQETSIAGALEDDVEKSEDRSQKSEVGDQKAETEKTEQQKSDQQKSEEK
ncbi:MAG: DUF4175 family protein [Planctomycetota bacterium]